MNDMTSGSMGALAAAGAANSLSFQGLNRLHALAKASPHDPALIRQVSSQFEALLVQQMLHSANATKLGPDLLGSTTGPLFESMMAQQLATTVTQGRGIGFASFLAHELAARYGSSGASTATPGGNAQGAAAAPAGVHAVPARGTPAATTPATPVDAASTGSSRYASTPADATPAASDEAPASPQQARSFIASILPSARAAAKALGVSPLGILAQAALETGWGQHAPGNNLFGIKAGAGWQGASLHELTTEVEGGLKRVGQAAFRAYRSAAASVRDYTNLLESPRYAAVRGHGGNLGAFAQALQSAGYASDPGYANKLLAVANGSTMRGALQSLGATAGSSLPLP